MRVILNGSALRWADMATTQLHTADENSNTTWVYRGQKGQFLTQMPRKPRFRHRIIWCAAPHHLVRFCGRI